MKKVKDINGNIIKIGDKVKIIDSGKTFSTYIEFFYYNNLNIKNFKYNVGFVPDNNIIGKILFIGKHEHKYYGNILLIKIFENGYDCLIKSDAVEFISRNYLRNKIAKIRKLI